MSTLKSFDAFLQLIQDYLRNGYTKYIVRKVDSEIELKALFRKNVSIWKADRNASNRYKAFRRGESVAIQCAFAHKDGKGFTCVLLIKPGKDYLTLAEGLPFKDATSKHERLTIFSYEVMHDGLGWTWRMTKSEMNKLNQSIERIARKNPKQAPITQDDFGIYDTDAENFQNSLYSRPGFRGVRKQVGVLVTKLRKEWQRYRPNNAIQPRQRTYLKYVKRIKRL